MASYTAKYKVKITLKELIPYGKWICSKKESSEFLKLEVMNIAEGSISLGYDTLHHNNIQLFLISAVKYNVFELNENGKNYI